LSSIISRDAARDDDAAGADAAGAAVEADA